MTALAAQFPIQPKSFAAVLSSGSSLGTGNDGQLAYYVADATNGVVWTFRYRTASASGSKWEFVGGPPLYSAVETQESSTGLNTNYNALTTAGPSITLPLAGDYDVSHGFRGTTAAAATFQLLMSYDIGGTGAVDADAVYLTLRTAGEDLDSVSRKRRKTGLTAATALVSKYKTSALQVGQFDRRWMAVYPVRVT